jgi:hypothetical protein
MGLSIRLWPPYGLSERSSQIFRELVTPLASARAYATHMLSPQSIVIEQ